MAEYTEQIVSSVRSNLGNRSGWTRWPGGWPGEISTALIDAVFSARAIYSTANGRGIHAQVRTWRGQNPTQVDSLSELLAEIESQGPDAWARAFGNEQHAPGRARRLPDDPTKAAAVRDAAVGLRSADVERAADITGDRAKDVGWIVQKVAGIGQATAAYFLMLLGFGGVKPDVMINRFLSEVSGGRRLSHKEAVEELTAAAERLDAEPHELEHAIWAWQRGTE